MDCPVTVCCLCVIFRFDGFHALIIDTDKETGNGYSGNTTASSYFLGLYSPTVFKNILCLFIQDLQIGM